jgi:ATP-dependent DNA helicase RecG
VGPKLQQALQRLHIVTVQDLLFHLPIRYQDRTQVVPVARLRPGAEALVEVEVLEAAVQFGRRRSLLVHASDATGVITLRFFYFNAKQQANFTTGTRLRCFGEVRQFQRHYEMVHPEYRRIFGASDAEVEQTLTPFYPLTEGIRQGSVRALIDQLVIDHQHLAIELTDWLPLELLHKLDFLKNAHYPSLAQAVAYLHKPCVDADRIQLEQGLHPAQQRLAFEELLAHHLSLRRLRHKQQRHGAPTLNAPGQLISRLQAALPFQLTQAQRNVLQEILDDLAIATPMQRLVQGDVGSGKTVVAALAALQAVESGYQVAVMAPTEILAEQHRRNLEHWLAPLDIPVHWLTGKIKGKQRQAVLQTIASDEAAVVVGTHALFQEDVSFANLGLVIVDEQHRFGVHQRLALRNKGANVGQDKIQSHQKQSHQKRQSIRVYPHQLIMTATPIPRTLAMTAYADLDCSVIDELPPGRSAVETVVISNQRREEVIARVHAACRSGRQSYWVCTLIEESEILQCQAAQDTHAQLQATFPDLRVGLVHGRLSSKEKDHVMNQFKNAEIDLLVATTVIEVGVDVPNATLMIIENAERLGLSQLHQLRGRVGRGSQHSVCVLMYQAPLSQTGRERLRIMRETNDGFAIARKDLELRGPGEVLGTRQTGIAQYRIANLQRDQYLLDYVAKTANVMFRQNPECITPLIKRWLGHSTQYGEV